MVAKKATKSTPTKVESITVRLHPRLKYGLELLSRKQHRTISAVVEWALNNVLLDDYNGLGKDIFETFWDPFEPDRFIKLAFNKPELLTYEEEILWKLIRENGYLWRGSYKKSRWQWDTLPSSLILDRLRDSWELFKAVSLAQESPKNLPAWQKESSKESSPTEDSLTEDDIPF